jgi:isopentenyl phosphate kinase
VKLGGSVITRKSVPRSYRPGVVRRLAGAIASAGLPVAVVHGGGSFGHPLAKRYGLSSRPTKSPRGVGETRRAMLELDLKVCASLSSAGLHPYTIAPFPLDAKENPAPIEGLLRDGATPVTFGDVVHDADGYRVLSGDTICAELSSLLGAARCVMAMDVDGALDARGKVIPVLDEEGMGRLRPAKASDATGGMSFKLKEAARMASAGTEVRLVSGLRPAEFSKALRGLDFHGTRIR